MHAKRGPLIYERLVRQFDFPIIEVKMQIDFYGMKIYTQFL
jgi:hypothetical protein